MSRIKFLKIEVSTVPGSPANALNSSMTNEWCVGKRRSLSLLQVPSIRLTRQNMDMEKGSSNHIEDLPVGETRVMMDSQGNIMMNDRGEPRREFKYIRINGDVGWYESLSSRSKPEVR